jgi:hypothetical protein
MAKQAVMTSPKLCGGILVAIPTAIPEEPFTNNAGTRAGKTVGSDSDSIKKRLILHQIIQTFER